MSKIFDTSHSTSIEIYPTIELCRLSCGEYGSLWPKPQNLKFSNRNLFVFNPMQITIEHSPSFDNHISRMVIDTFRTNLEHDYRNCSKCKDKRMRVKIHTESDTTVLDWNTDESYSLKIETLKDNAEVEITSKTIFGARHGLETLSQLMTSYPEEDNSICLAVIKGVTIEDRPFYSHRGLLLDTSRNYLSIATIKKHIRAMATSKMNFLHWHITDAQSFPMETPSVPNMTRYGAYSPSAIYKYEDIKHLIQYGLYHGVRVFLEMDAPAHAGYGWQWGPEAGLGDLTVCLNHQPWRQACIQPPCGQLNPSNHRVYDVLQDIYADIIKLLPSSSIIHMGGDELFIPCWNSTEQIIRYIGNKPRSMETFLDLWSEFQNEALKRYDKVVGNKNSPVILWTSHLTDPQYVERYLNKDRYIIQTWVPNTDNLPEELMKLGYKLIISTKNAWYLDHGFWGTTEYYDWRKVYDNQISNNKLVLGGEVCMWGEYVDDASVLTRTWPRAAAAAERLWSNPVTSSNQADARFYSQRQRLISRGIDADAVGPRWCYLNEGQCLS
ncbi:hypothetical protein WA026_017398 [Henosepilachna vigintioctopunctata]|uniref:Beta-hexosaminidase n=1 Tax=Henosepilachna vigintioctopunctata TaxID=420089 RepID=A0AAW1VHX2_9CUCU